MNNYCENLSGSRMKSITNMMKYNLFRSKWPGPSL